MVLYEWKIFLIIYFKDHDLHQYKCHQLRIGIYLYHIYLYPDIGNSNQNT